MQKRKADTWALTMKYMTYVVSAMAALYITAACFCIATFFLPKDPRDLNFLNGYSALFIPLIIGIIAGIKLQRYLLSRLKYKK